MTASNGQHITISAPNFQTGEFKIRGLTPYVQNKFSQKALGILRDQQEAGSTARKGSKRDPKDFNQAYEEAIHYSEHGWIGIPATAFRGAMIRACSVVGFKMTLAKLSVFVEADGYDRDDGTPLVKFTKGEPHYVEHRIKNQTGVPDIRPRPMWDPGWEAIVRIRFDADQFTIADVANLLMRVGLQVGIGEGRSSSSRSHGMGWGVFEVMSDE